MTHRLTTNYVKNYCNWTLTVKVIIENVVTCFLGHGVVLTQVTSTSSLYGTDVPCICFTCKELEAIYSNSCDMTMYAGRSVIGDL